MVSTLNLEEKYNKVRRNFCFYLDIQDNGLARSLSRRLQDLGLQQEVFLTSRVTHVVRDGAPGSADAARAGVRRLQGCNTRARTHAMVERARPHPAHTPSTHHVINVRKAISLLDKLYDTFFAAPRRPLVKHFTKHYIKIEFLDKICRPVFKEFDDWPEIPLEPDPPKEKKDKKESTTTATANKTTNDFNQNQQTIGQKMTRKSRPRIKEKDDKEAKGGYCEMCNAQYADAASHRSSPHHLAFVRDHNNFLALDSLIGSGNDVTTFLDKATAINGERRSLRNMCNGELEPKCRRSKRSQSPESSVNGETSPQRNGAHNTHNTRSKHDDDRHYYKVVGVSTKLRSSGACLASRHAPKHRALNGDKPLVVKFRKVRKSELSVLSDEAEQFMFPKRASSTSSTDDDDDDKEKSSSRKKNSTPQPPPTLERRRLARPVALKEESSEEDGWPDDKRRRKRKAPPPVKRGRRLPLKPPEDSQAEEISPVEPGLLNVDLGAAEPPAEDAVSPLRAEPAAERCVRWEAGRLRYSAAVDRLEFAFESVPRSEPWYETFKRQDHDQIITKNVPKYFALYTTSPKLPYEIGTLPPLKPNCCPLSELVRRDDRAGGAGGAGAGGAGARCYGTRGKKKQKMRKRTELVQALEAHPRKSPREHASTLAILGSAGLLHRRKNGDDAKSTASEDTISDTQSHLKIEPVVNEALEASERLQQFFAEVFDDAAEYEVSDEAMEGDTALMTSTNAPDVTSLVSECENCDIIRNEIQENVEARARARRGRFKKKNKTGWPNKKKAKKDSRTNSLESQKGESSLDRSSAEPPDDDNTRDAISEVDTNLSEAENEKTLIELKQEEEARVKSEPMETDESPRTNKHTGKRSPRSSNSDSGKRTPRSSASDEDKEERRKKKRALAGLLLQPVVRVARVDPNAARRLRSADKARSGRLR